MKWMRCSGLPALPVQATSARGRCLRGLRAQSGRKEARRRGSGIEGPRPGPARAQGAAGLPAPNRQPRRPCAIPGAARALPPAGRGGAGLGWRVPNPPGGCARDSAAEAHWRGGPAEERARRAGRSAGRTEGRPDAPAHADAHSSARLPSHTRTHIHTRADTYRDTRRYTHPRARTSARPLAGAWSPLWPVSVAFPSAPLCGEPEGGGRAVPPGAASPLTPPPAPRGPKLAPAPATPPRGSRRPRTGVGSPPRGGGRALGSRKGAATIPRGARTQFHGGIGIGVRVRASAAEASARLWAASPLQVCSSRGRLDVAASLFAWKPRLPRLASRPRTPQLHPPTPHPPPK